MARFISESEIQVLPRGRTAELDGDLVEILAELTPGQAVVLDEEFGPVAEDDRQSVRAKIAKHFKAAHGDGTKCTVNYSLDGYAQVKVRA